MWVRSFCVVSFCVAIASCCVVVCCVVCVTKFSKNVPCRAQACSRCAISEPTRQRQCAERQRPRPWDAAEGEACSCAQHAACRRRRCVSAGSGAELRGAKGDLRQGGSHRRRNMFVLPRALATDLSFAGPGRQGTADRTRIATLPLSVRRHPPSCAGTQRAPLARCRVEAPRTAAQRTLRGERPTQRAGSSCASLSLVRWRCMRSW